MNTHRVLRIPMVERLLVALILLTVGGVAILITVVWPLIHGSPGQPSSQADPWEVVNDFHVAINSNNIDEALALFTDNATITDNKSPIDDRYQIRNWILYSKQMIGLQLRMFHSEMDGDKLIWLDTAYKGLEAQSRYYILRWEAVIAEGKIRSLVVVPRYMPDLK